MEALYNVLPACVVERELPEKPHGWFKRHLGRCQDESGPYELFGMVDDHGISVPILYEDRLMFGGGSGYKVGTRGAVVDWDELREKWPGICAEQKWSRPARFV